MILVFFGLTSMIDSKFHNKFMLVSLSRVQNSRWEVILQEKSFRKTNKNCNEEKVLT